MIKLLQGDTYNLEGKVIVYSKIRTSKNFPSDDNPFILALYATNDVDTFAQLFKIPDDVKNKLLDGNKFLEEDSNSGLVKKLGGDEEDLIPQYGFYIGDLSFHSEQEILDFGVDVLYAGEYHDPNLCDAANMVGVDIYALKYSGQRAFENITKKPKKSTTKKTVTKNTTNNSPPKTKDSNNTLKSYINKNFINPLISFADKDERSYNIIKDKFLRYVAGKVYDEDALELSDIIRSYGKLQDYNLINAYLDKIDALNREDYTMAAKMRDEIKRLRKD